MVQWDGVHGEGERAVGWRVRRGRAPRARGLAVGASDGAGSPAPLLRREYRVLSTRKGCGKGI